jgi:hypothetical protein
MKQIRYAIFPGGLIILALAFGFIFQVPFATSLWPWPDGRLSYLFIGSILAAVSAAALWIGWSGELSALPAGALNVFVIAAMSSFYFFQLALRDGRVDLLPSGIVALLMVFKRRLISLESATAHHRIPFDSFAGADLIWDISCFAGSFRRSADLSPADLPMDIESRFFGHIRLYLPRGCLLLFVRASLSPLV